MFSADLLTAAPHTRLPQFGYEAGRDAIMDAYTREAPASAPERLVRDFERLFSKSAVWRSAVWVEGLLHTPVVQIRSLVPGAGVGAGQGGAGRGGASERGCGHGRCDGSGERAASSGQRRDVSTVCSQVVTDGVPELGLTGGLAMRRQQAEAVRQEAFERDLHELRRTLEDALFAQVARGCRV